MTESPDALIPLVSKEGRLIPRFCVYLTEQLREAGIPPESYVEVRLGTDFECPTLILSFAGQEKPPNVSSLTRTVTAESRVSLPGNLVVHRDGPLQATLNLDPATYQNNNRLLFEPIVGEQIIALVPRRWEDGTEYKPGTYSRYGYWKQRVLEERSVEPIDREPDQHTTTPEIDICTKIPEEYILRAHQHHGVDREVLRAAIKSVEESDPSPEIVEEYEPLRTDQCSIFVVEDIEWTKIQLDVEIPTRELIDAVKMAHRLYAQKVIEQEGTIRYYRAGREHEYFVV
ncbi:hypothetical protein [Haloarchaeobius sp. HRN-SO-5]|uniref:hypothetical protein n=1 Tax=Haloarchaeobius sp. HRN-SO-5 TaxID=3446118 RepID=UPI003EB972D1